jgi:TonB family protein
MEFVPFLLAVSARSIGLAAAAWGLLTAARVQSPTVRYAVWSLVMAGMLAIAAARLVLPPLPVRVLRPQAPAVTTEMAFSAQAPIPAPARERPFPWAAIYATGLLLFGGRLARGYALTRRLVKGSRRVARWEHVYASEEVHVPLTVGWLRPRILLPADWEQWAPQKLDAVLTHERNHVRRGDWAIAVLAGVNRCVFWFHPLAWWLEARLSVLAEQACDDASLSQVASAEDYAQVLVEMAAAVRRGKGRTGREAMAMARGAEVSVRIERILDENRPVFPAMTQRRWMVLALCAVPVVYLAAVARPARVRAEAQAPVPAVASQRVPQQQEPPAKPEAEAQPGDLGAQRQEELSTIMAQLKARAQYLEAQRQYQQSETTRAEQEMKAVEAEIAAYESQLVQAREAYTDQSPTVRRLQTVLEHLRQQHETPISGPRLISRTEPEYTPEARKAGLEGKIELSVTIDTEGRPTDIEVTHGLSAGLDEKAVECVNQWRFRPALRNGQPVTAFASVEVLFRLQ